MADEPLELSAEEPGIERALERGGIVESVQEKKKAPIYSIVGKARIPVSKHTGKLWKSRMQQGLKRAEKAREAWDEAIRYYENDQMRSNRLSLDNAAGNNAASNRLSDEWVETENVIYANVTTMLPMVYSKNPDVSITATTEDMVPLAQCCERLLNVVMSLRTRPGVNLKPKARRGVLSALLTNCAWMEVGWTQKDDSSETVLQELAAMSEELQKAKDGNKIEEIEGKLQALEEQIDVVSPAGPFVRLRHPKEVVVDPTSVEPDHSDANWIMYYDVLPSKYVQARYGQKNKDGEWRSIYQPSHVLKVDAAVGEGVHEQINSFQLLIEEDNGPSAYGYDDQEAFDRAKQIKIWYVWDRTTRRIYMFNDKDWTWPIWVFDDPYRLPEFFPLYRLTFHESIDGPNPKGETTYIIDQQDAINNINSEKAYARRWAARHVVYDKSAITKDAVESFLKGVTGTATGIDIPEGRSIQDVITTVVPPSMKFGELFDASSQYAAIDRISSVREVMRGQQFKTNTTNEAVAAYAQSAEVRTDEKTDLTEEWIGSIASAIMLMALQFWTREDIEPIIGSELASAWPDGSVDVQDLFRRLPLIVEGGSSTKPTSIAKKKEAMELGQIMGQFADAAPAVVIVMLKMFSKAFSEFAVTDEDWNMILQTMMQQQQQAGAGPQGNLGQQEQGKEMGGRDAGIDPAQIKAEIQAMPPEARQMLEQLVQQGMKPSEAFQQVKSGLQQGAN